MAKISAHHSGLSTLVLYLYGLSGRARGRIGTSCVELVNARAYRRMSIRGLSALNLCRKNPMILRVLIPLEYSSKYNWFTTFSPLHPLSFQMYPYFSSPWNLALIE